MILEVNNLVCGYGDITVVNNFSFRVKGGQILGLIGANGAGKTSAILALSGLIPVREGEVRIEGRDVTNLAAHKRVLAGFALVPEGRRVFAELSVEENLLIGGIRLSKKRMRNNRDRIFSIFPIYCYCS